jgi:hypothetical protein
MTKLIISSLFLMSYLALIYKGIPQFFLTTVWMDLLSLAVSVIAGAIFMVGFLETLDRSTRKRLK